MKTSLITREGLEKLKAELDHLWRVERPETTQKVSWAASLGDRSENADYQYNKKRLREIDRRVRYLSKRLEILKVVEDVPSDPEAIFFGARFEIEHADTGETSQYRIVGPDETDAKLGWISIDSPLARAAIKKRVDDEFEAQLPTGLTKFYILRVQYSLFD